MTVSINYPDWLSQISPRMTLVTAEDRTWLCPPVSAHLAALGRFCLRRGATGDFSTGPFDGGRAID
jgi:hypothetical protein